MAIFTGLYGRKLGRSVWIALCLAFASATVAIAAPDTTTTVPGPGQISLDHNLAATNSSATNAPTTNGLITVTVPPEPATPVPVVPVAPPAVVAAATPSTTDATLFNLPRSVLGALLTLTSLGGFLLYYCGLSRAKNSGHTSMLLLVAVLFGLTGYWIGGFAVQTGGVGDTHAALTQPVPYAERTALNHELGPVIFGHHWGLMGSSGFFLVTDDSARDGVALLFLTQAGLLAIVLAAALGGALERGKILAMAFCAYLIGVLVYPLLANWVWGGGWLAELGREFGLGHGFIDLGGASVVHETAGVLALILATVLGPRHGRYGRTNPPLTIPGHNVPFIVLGSMILLISWMATNAFASSSLSGDAASPGAALAAINTLLAAMGGMVATFVQASWQKSKPEPSRICRGLLGGAVASCGGANLLDPWAAFIIGCVAGLLVQVSMAYLLRKRVDDPVGAAAVHGAGGVWGVIAVGFFANGATGDGFNGVPHEVRGLFYGGAWHQLAAQVLGCITSFAVICILGWFCVSLVQKILGNRVDLTEEAGGLDWSEVGALGYQGDVETEENGKS